ncbi:MAG: lipid-A-disaccharide synthase, partial [Acetobacteraceae bacterium]
RMVRVRFASLVNLVLDREAIPEMIQERSEPTRLAAELGKLLESPDVRGLQRQAFAEALRALKPAGAMLPSERAAAVVLDVARRGKRGT